MYEGNLRFKIDWASLQWEGNLPFLLCFTLYSSLKQAHDRTVISDFVLIMSSFCVRHSRQTIFEITQFKMLGGAYDPL